MSACEDFFLLLKDTLTAAIKVFKMDSTEVIPQASQYFPKGCENLNESEKDEVLLSACAHVVSHFVDLEILDSTSKPGDGKRSCCSIC